MKAKEWAKANGFPDISLGRGRMPADARAAVEAAVARGVKLEGYEAVAKSGDAPAEVKRVSPDAARVFDVPDESRSEALWTAHTTLGEIGMRTVCDLCHNSLTYCHCQHPRVLVQNTEVMVVFKPRKNPEQFRNRWW